MKLGTKIKEEYTKERTGYLFRTSEYILHDPEAFQILLIMSNFFGAFFFGSLFTMSLIYSWDTAVKVLFLMFTAFMIYKAIKNFKNRHLWKGMTEGATVYGMLKGGK